MIKAIIFDLDDTLYDEADYCRSGFWAAAEYLGGLSSLPTARKPDSSEIFETLWGEFEAGNHTRTFNRALEKLGIDFEEETIRNLVELYRSHEPKINLPAESKEILELLHPRYKMGLVTDGFLPAQQLKVAALGIEGYFAAIVYSEQLGREHWKPSVVPFKRILRQLKVKASESVYVADNAQKDFIGPNKLGMETLQIIRDRRVHKESPAERFSAPKQIITRLGQIPGALERLF